MELMLLIQCCQSDLFHLEFQYLELLLRTKCCSHAALAALQLFIASSSFSLLCERRKLETSSPEGQASKILWKMSSFCGFKPSVLTSRMNILGVTRWASGTGQHEACNITKNKNKEIATCVIFFFPQIAGFNVNFIMGRKWTDTDSWQSCLCLDLSQKQDDIECVGWDSWTW